MKITVGSGSLTRYRVNCPAAGPPSDHQRALGRQDRRRQRGGAGQVGVHRRRGGAGRGQSLIVWAIAEGRAAAAAVDTYLTGATTLPSPILPTERPLVV